MQVLLHNIPKKYLNRLNEPDKSHIKKALKGLEKEPPDWKPIIEPATPEEAAMIDERMKDYDNDPSSFSPLDF